MATAVPTVDQIAAQLGVQNPLTAGLSDGLHADPTYLSFLRGAGFTYDQAVQTAFQQMTAARTNYATQSARLPEQLAQAQEVTDTGLQDRGAFNSGERLRRETQNVTTNQEQGQDLLSARAAAIQQAQSGLQGAISDLARQQADAEGGLQDRLQQRADQDRYINAVAGSHNGGGGGASLSLPPLPAAPSAPAPAAPASPSSHIGGSIAATTAPGQPATPTGPVQPALAPGQHINDYFASQPLRDYLGQLTNAQQGQFLAFTQAQYPGANFAPLLTTIGAIQAGRGSPTQQAQNQQGLRAGTSAY